MKWRMTDFYRSYDRLHQYLKEKKFFIQFEIFIHFLLDSSMYVHVFGVYPKITEDAEGINSNLIPLFKENKVISTSI